MKKLFLLASLCITALAHAADRPEVGRYVKAYSGEEGVKVFVLRLGAPEKAEALVQIAGIDHPLDGVIQKARVEAGDRDGTRSYTTTRNGRDYMLLRLDRDSGTVYLPSQPNTLREPRVKYDDTLSQRAAPEPMLTEWLQQSEKK